jgi:hypothetical protein
MTILDHLEKKFGKYTFVNLTGILIAGQIFLYIYIMLVPASESGFMLVMDRVFGGQWWRIFTFVFLPIDKSPVFAVFTWYIYYLYGSALEREWGSFRYQAYILIGYSATLFSGLLYPVDHITNAYIYTSIFLAFAYLFPDFILLLFFIIPVKVKWLSYLLWIGIAGAFLTGLPGTKVLMILSVLNYLIFFGGGIISGLRHKTGKLSKRALNQVKNKPAYMRCAICGATEADRKIFYYCHKCIPETCYCEDHINNHSHKRVN